MDAVLARKMWRTLEPYHGLIYFTPEAEAAYRPFGLEGRGGYFASRAAPMGAVSAGVVVATFFNFDPRLVHAAIPSAWERAAPGRWSETRLTAVDRALRAILGDAVDGPEMVEAADLARAATDACTAPGRPLYAGHAELPWPDPPHLLLWHAATLLREFRGDGHVACLTDEGVDGCQALVVHGATGEVAPDVLRATRGWSDEAWSTATEGLRARGILAGDGSLTEAGQAHRRTVEDRTDELALVPWEHIGQDRADRLRALVRPFSRTVVDSGAFGFR